MSAKAWTLSFLAVPVIYVLTFPPLAVFSAQRLPRPDPVYAEAPPWLVTYGKPYNRLMDSNVIGKPLSFYFNLWWLFRYP